MIALLITLGFLIFVMVIAVATLTSRVSFPREYRLAESPIRGLSDAEVALVGLWSRQLEALGFARVGEFSIRLDHGTNAAYQQIDQYRVWLDADRRIWACMKHEAFFDHTGVGVARSRTHLSFSSRTADGVTVRTHNHSIQDGFEKHPKLRLRPIPELRDAEPLLTAHRLHLGGETNLEQFRPEDHNSYVQQRWEEKTRWSTEHGYLRADGDRFRFTPKLAVLGVMYGWNPLRAELGSRWVSAFKVLASALGVGVISTVARREVAPEYLDYVLAGLGALWGVAGSLISPRLSFFSWFYAFLPAYLFLDLHEGYHGWAFVPSFLLATLVGSVVERLRYRIASKRLDASVPKASPMSATAKVALAIYLLLCATFAVAMHVIVRSPFPIEPGLILQRLAGLIVSLGFILLFGLWSITALLPSCRKWAVYPWIQALGKGGFLVLAGMCSGFFLERADLRISAQRAEVLQRAVLQFRHDEGHYPAGLEELVPKYLPKVPVPRVGFAEVQFDYRTRQVGRGKGFWLNYRSASPQFEIFSHVDPDDETH